MFKYKYFLILLIVSATYKGMKYRFMCVQLPENCIKTTLDLNEINICTTTFKIEQILKGDKIRTIIDKEQYVIVERERWGVIGVDGVRNNCEKSVNDNYVVIEGDFKLYRHRSFTDKFENSEFTPKGCLTCKDKSIQTYEFVSEQYHTTCDFCSNIKEDINDNPKSQWTEIIISFKDIDEENDEVDEEVDEEKLI